MYGVGLFASELMMNYRSDGAALHLGAVPWHRLESLRRPQFGQTCPRPGRPESTSSIGGVICFCLVLIVLFLFGAHDSILWFVQRHRCSGLRARARTLKAIDAMSIQDGNGMCAQRNAIMQRHEGRLRHQCTLAFSGPRLPVLLEASV